MPFGNRHSSPYSGLRAAWLDSAWLQALCDKADATLENHPHGDLARWLMALEALPETHTSLEILDGVPTLGASAPDQQALTATLMQLHPWRKGPMQLGGCFIDTEWRSDRKWQRLEKHLELMNKRVLDIGCGNGYFGWRMLAAGARLVVGIDPTLLFVMQWLACRHFAGPGPNFVLPLGIEHLPDPDHTSAMAADFDCVFSMGVLYHRRDHLQHLRQIRQLLKPGGQMILETLVLPDDRKDEILVPEDRYARMRNVWAIPGSGLLQSWVREAGFEQVNCVDITPTTMEEQRSTNWMRFESLAEALDQKNPGLTLEGYPAPARAIVLAVCPGRGD